MKDLKDILEGIFDEEDNVRKLDKNVNFSSWIKKLTNPHTFEKSSKDFIKEIIKDGAKKTSWTSMEYNEGNYVRVMKAIDKDTNEEFIRIDIFIYEGHKRWKDHILHNESKKVSVNILSNWMVDFIRMEANFIEWIECQLYTLPDDWTDFIKFIKKEYDKSYINESIFDDEGVQMDKLDDLTKFGNMYHIKWYDMSDDHTFPYMFKPQNIKKIAKELGRLDKVFYKKLLSCTGVRGMGITVSKNSYMIPLAELIGHVQFDKNKDELERRIQQVIKDNARSLPVLVTVEDRTNSRVIRDDSIDVSLRVVVDDTSKYIRFRFEKNV